MENANPFVNEYLKVFPHARPSIFQMELIETNISDLAAWKETLIWWAGNDYRAQSVFKMIEYYKEQVKTNPDAECAHCRNSRRVTVNDYSAPCPKCRPAEERAFWKVRGRIVV